MNRGGADGAARPRLLADEKILGAADALSFDGAVAVDLAAADAITNERLRDGAYAFLCVRSTTRVDAALIAGTRVRFVGTATIGVDHVDLGALRRAGIDFASAAGSSAATVAEYTLALMLLEADRLGRDFAGATVGVVGAGAIGERVARLAEACGARVLRHDPPLAQRRERDARYVDRDALGGADFVSLHVPLERDGAHPTVDLVDRAFLIALSKAAVLVNTARGEVVDEAAVVDARESGRLAGLALDVFRGEPRPDARLLAACTLASPHVAGRSLEGLQANTRAVATAIARTLGLAVPVAAAAARRAGASTRPTPTEILNRVRAAWRIEDDSALLRADATRFGELRDREPLRRDLGLVAAYVDERGLIDD